MLDKQQRVAATHHALDRFFAHIHTPEGRREVGRIRAARARQAPITSSLAVIERACVAGKLTVAEAIELARRLR